MRIRTQGGIDTVPMFSTCRITTCGGSQREVNYAKGDLVNGVIQTTQDIVVKDFKRRQALGEIFNNPYKSTKLTVASGYGGSGTKSYTCSSNPSSTRSEMWTSWAPTAVGLEIYFPGCRLNGVNVTNLRTLAGTQALANITKPDIQSLVAMAEMRKTLNTVPDILKVNRKLIDQMVETERRKIRAKLAKGKMIDIRLKQSLKSVKLLRLQAFKTIASSYLGYRYGITPIMYDLARLSVGMVDERASVRYTARGKSEGSDSGSDSFVSPAGTTNVVYSADRELNVVVRAGVLYIHRLSYNKLGLNFVDVPRAIHELTPYSFVLDWFVNIGDWVSALTPEASVKVLAKWTTVSTTDEHTISLETTAGIVPIGQSVSEGRTGFVTRKLETKERSPGVRFGVAHRLDDVSRLRAKEFTHVADAIALFAKFLRGK